MRDVFCAEPRCAIARAASVNKKRRIVCADARVLKSRVIRNIQTILADIAGTCVAQSSVSCQLIVISLRLARVEFVAPQNGGLKECFDVFVTTSQQADTAIKR